MLTDDSDHICCRSSIPMQFERTKLRFTAHRLRLSIVWRMARSHGGTFLSVENRAWSQCRIVLWFPLLKAGFPNAANCLATIA